MPPKFRILGILVILIIAAVLFLFVSKSNKVQADSFGGYVERIEKNRIIAKGTLFYQGQPVSEGTDKEIQIDITDQTVLRQIELLLPSGVTQFNTKDLQKREAAADLAYIAKAMEKRGVGIEANLQPGKNKTNFKGTSINFRVLVVEGEH